MNRANYIHYILILVLLLTACTKQEIETNPINSTPENNPILLNSDIVANNNVAPTNFPELKVVMGETIYIPVYSHVYYLNKQRPYYLAANLVIHNTDTTYPIVITSVKYYDTQGNLIKQYLEQPQTLKPLASTDFFVAENDTTGGIGANFIVEWVAENIVSQPIAESVMIGTAGTQGISLISPGRVINKEQIRSNKYSTTDSY